MNALHLFIPFVLYHIYFVSFQSSLCHCLSLSLCFWLCIFDSLRSTTRIVCVICAQNVVCFCFWTPRFIYYTCITNFEAHTHHTAYDSQLSTVQYSAYSACIRTRAEFQTLTFDFDVCECVSFVRLQIKITEILGFFSVSRAEHLPLSLSLSCSISANWYFGMSFALYVDRRGTKLCCSWNVYSIYCSFLAALCTAATAAAVQFRQRETEKFISHIPKR